MRLDPRFLNWGVFFILLGGIPLAVDQGWIAADAIAGWWRYWPLILIGIGVGLLLRRTPVHFLGGLIVAATFGLMLGSAPRGRARRPVRLRLHVGPGGNLVRAPERALGPSGVVRLELSCGDLTVTTAAGPGLVPDRDHPGRPSRRAWRPLPAGSRISSDRSGVGFFGSGGGSETWALALPTDDPRPGRDAERRVGPVRPRPAPSSVPSR